MVGKEENVLCLLTKARALISNKYRWTSVPARDYAGYLCSPQSPQAHYFSAVGALEHLATATPQYVADGSLYCALSVLREVSCEENLEIWNTRAGQAVVVATFDAAIDAIRLGWIRGGAIKWTFKI